MSRDSDFEGQWDLITELPQDWGKQTLGEYEQNFVSTKTQGREAVIPQETRNQKTQGREAVIPQETRNRAFLNTWQTLVVNFFNRNRIYNLSKPIVGVEWHLSC